MSGYDDIEVDGGGEYVKLTAGTVVTIHILSRTPKKELVHWVDKKKMVCSGQNCAVCSTGDKPKQRWTAEVWDRKDMQVKKLEFGAMIAGQLKSIAEMLKESNQDIHAVDIRIKTTGANLETEYSVLHVPKMGDIPAEVLDKYEIPF